MEEEKKEEEKKAEEDQGPNGCIVCLQATWDVIYVRNLLHSNFNYSTLLIWSLLTLSLWITQGIYAAIKFVIMTICNGIAYCWYPMKERCVDCCASCNRCLNPHEDEAYSTFEWVIKEKECLTYQAKSGTIFNEVDDFRWINSRLLLCLINFLLSTSSFR